MPKTTLILLIYEFKKSDLEELQISKIFSHETLNS